MILKGDYMKNDMPPVKLTDEISKNKYRLYLHFD